MIVVVADLKSVGKVSRLEIQVSTMLMVHSLAQNLQGRLGGSELKQDFCYCV